MNPTLGKIRRTNGVADQFSLTVDVTYPGENTQRVTFVSNRHSSRVIMIHPVFGQDYVTDPERFGDSLTPGWVRRFYGQV